MGIDLMATFNRVQPYYRASEIPSVSAPEAEKPQNPLEEQEKVSAVESSRRPEANAKLEDISLTFHKEENFDYLGSESDLAKLDMEKAISDMRKDSILQDYQYFVGGAAPEVSTEDGLVFRK